MSRIYFHGKDGDAEVRGSERAHMGVTCSDLLITMLQIDKFAMTEERIARWRRALPPGSYIETVRSEQFTRSLETFISVQGQLAVGPGEYEDTFRLALNTATRIGSDPLKLFARLHGQCEIHAWVDGPDRKWLAGIISQGLDIGLMRAEQGWEATVEFLLSDDSSEVVTSYSVCEQFPDASTIWDERFRCTIQYDDAGEDDGPLYDEWEALGGDEQWRQGMEWLRAKSDGLQMQPSEWDTFYFGSGKTAFDVLRFLDSSLHREKGA